MYYLSLRVFRQNSKFENGGPRPPETKVRSLGPCDPGSATYAGKAAVCDEIQPEMLKALNQGVLWALLACVRWPGVLEEYRMIGKLR